MRALEQTGGVRKRAAHAARHQLPVAALPAPKLGIDRDDKDDKDDKDDTGVGEEA